MRIKTCCQEAPGVLDYVLCCAGLCDHVTSKFTKRRNKNIPWIIGFLALLAFHDGIASWNYQVEINFAELIGRGKCVPLFAREEIEINHIPKT